MDERTKELARQYMNRISERNPRPGKFQFDLTYRREDAEAVLLGAYGSEVQRRDGDLIIDDATASKVEKTVRWIYDSRKRGLLLCGTLGNGKTTMLRALKLFFGFKASYYEAQTLYDHYRKNQSFPDISNETVLLIDDLGVEPATYNDFGEIRYPLAELLMRRYKSNLPTVIATNLSFEKIGEIYGDRLQDRMREMFAMIQYVEPSYRK